MRKLFLTLLLPTLFSVSSSAQGKLFKKMFLKHPSKSSSTATAKKVSSSKIASSAPNNSTASKKIVTKPGSSKSSLAKTNSARSPKPNRIEANAQIQIGSSALRGSGKFGVIVSAMTKKHSAMKYLLDRATKVVVTRTDGDILTDGDISQTPLADRIHDSHHQNQIAFDRPFNPYEINYTVIPEESRVRTALSNYDVGLGTIYYVIDLETGKSSFGMVADVGPGGQVTNGEFSVHQIRELDLPVDKATGTGGVDSNRLVTVLFPNSHDLITKGEIMARSQSEIQALINQHGAALLSQYEEKTKSKNLENLIGDVKNVTAHVNNYD